jgi:ketosteroid isomerase-like protein
MVDSAVLTTRTSKTVLDHHFAAVAGHNVDQILVDYSDRSVVAVYSMQAGQQYVFKGLLAIEACFQGLCGVLSDLTTFDTLVSDVDERQTIGSAFRAWTCPSSGIELASDTFLLDEAQKISMETLVLWATDIVLPVDMAGLSTSIGLSDGPVRDVWNNHVSAFGAKDVDRVLLDYTDDSLVVVFDKQSGTKTVFSGLSGVKELFIGLFTDLIDLSELGVPFIQVTEEPGSVFLIWKCPSSNVSSATDTVFVDEHAKIKYQTVVIEKLVVEQVDLLGGIH